MRAFDVKIGNSPAPEVQTRGHLSQRKYANTCILDFNFEVHTICVLKRKHLSETKQHTLFPERIIIGKVTKNL
jgi:hypothetical protein